jgi:hypothetical protein
VRYAITICLAGAALSLSACGGTSSPGAGGSTSPEDTAASNGKALQFATCMRSHGVPNFPDPTGGHIDLQIQQTPNSTSVNGVQVNGPGFKSAMQSCQSYLPQGKPLSAGQTAKARSQALAMARCMRSHGVPNFPDPVVQSGPNGGIAVKISGAGIDPSSPAFRAAQKDCRGIFGGALPIAKAPG